MAGPKVVIDYLINRCRSLIYSTSLSPAAVSAASWGFDVIRDQPQRRARVRQLARRVRDELTIAADPLESSVPIIPVVMGNDQNAVAAARRLVDLGLFVPAIRPPTVPEGTARLRISLSAAHDDAMLDTLVEAIGQQFPRGN